MPAPGDQHNTGAANPFEEPRVRISEFTAQEIATLQSRLDKQLGPEYLSSRPGPGNKKVHYITAEKIIQLANEVFGFNGWSSSIQNIQVDFVEENTQKMTISIGLSVIVRVTLRDGTFHEDIGYGSIDNCKGKAAAFEKAKKEGTTDGLKRALRSFGNVLGNCIYDKTYLTNVTKMKVQTSKFDHDRLYRHPDYTVKKEEPTQPPRAAIAAAPAKEEEDEEQALPRLTAAESEDFDFLVELDDADFCVSEEGHPDEVAIPDTKSQNEQRPTTGSTNPPQQNPNFRASTGSMQPPPKHMGRTPSGPLPRQPQTPNQAVPPRPVAQSGSYNRGQNHMPNGRPQQHQASFNRPPPPQQQQRNGVANNAQNAGPGPQGRPNSAPTQQQQPQATRPQQEPPAEVGFFSARGVINVPEGKDIPVLISANAPRFDPKHESPSIRKTPGIDHNSSKPVARNGTHVPPSSQGNNDSTPVVAGAPGGAGSFIALGGRPGGGFNGGSTGFKAPTPRAQQQHQHQPGNVVNPHMNQARTIGAPGGASPLANRGQYRPPLKRPMPGGEQGQGHGGVGRPPLHEVSNNSAVAAAGGGVGGQDAKRVKMG